MAHRVGDRILDTTTSTGTGNITVSGTAAVNHKTVSDFATVNGDTVDLVVAGGTQWEYNRFTRVSANEYTPAATPFASSTGSKINFAAGTKEVFSDVGVFFSKMLNTVEIDVASAATADILGAAGKYIQITGTTTITSFGAAAHQERVVRFAGALTLTHNATSLILLGGASRTTAAGDIGIYKSDASGNVREIAYFRAAYFATTTIAGVVELATDAEVRSGAAVADRVLTSAHIENASAGVALTDAATVAVDWDSGINFTLTVTANRIIGNPTNGQPGTSRTILVQGDSTTDRTITFGNQYLGSVPTITDCDSGKWYLLRIYCVTTTHFVVSSQVAKS